MSDAVVDVIQPHTFNGQKALLPITICEHSNGTMISHELFASSGKTRKHHPIFGGGRNELRIGPGGPPGQRGHYIVEFRYPHTKLGSFADEFQNMFNRETRVTGPAGMPIYVTYGKHKPDQAPLISKESIGGLLEGGGASAAAGVGEGAGLVAASAGAAALAGPLSIGVGIGVACIIGTVAAAKQHRQNKLAQQVFVRISNDPISKARLFDYETKHYHETFYANGCSFRAIASDIEAYVG